MISWQLIPFNKLSTAQLYQLLRLRVDIFVVEQNCRYPELDGKDTLAGVQHLLGVSNGEIIACARLLPAGTSFDNVSIGRIAIKKTARGNGLGHQLLRQALQQCEKLWPEQSIDIGAQQYLLSFYLQHEFKAISKLYLDDGIPHEFTIPLFM